MIRASRVKDNFILKSQRSASGHRNWPFILGIILTVGLVGVALYGPYLARHDPLQENYTLSVDGQIVRPPYPPFEIPDFPLGTDQFGRDLLSRILWAVRPTLELVVIVAVIRLAAGVLIGMAAGWYEGLIGRFLENLISLALSVPILLVGLMGITAVGLDRGVFAFMFGMALTGWADTARLVSAETRNTRSQIYIEAAKALGASSIRIILRHILRQIIPIIWMLFAYEISATLLLTAELGFLGYFIGGGVWIEVLDFVNVNTASQPELGQMLSTALITLVNPWPLVLIGSVIFISILGFNLLGEGLRRNSQLSLARVEPRIWLLQGKIGEWIDEKVMVFNDWIEAHALPLGVGLAGVLVLSLGTIWLESNTIRFAEGDGYWLTVPGAHPWASARHDAQGSLWAGVDGPKQPRILWSLLAPGGLDGGPAVTTNGDLIIAATHKILFRISPDGKELWRADIPEEPVGAPALGPEGEIYVAGVQGSLYAFTESGTLKWSYNQSGREATAGPIVSSNGVIYYTRVDRVYAVNPSGKLLWNSPELEGYLEQPPALSAGESFIFLVDNALDAGSGIPLLLEGLPVDVMTFAVPAFVVGANGKTYIRTGHAIYAWRSTEAGIVIDSQQTWPYSSHVPVTPSDQGATPDGRAWFLYSGDFFDTRLIWIEPNSRQFSQVRLANRQAYVVAMDRQNTTYICASNFGAMVNCMAVNFVSSGPAWEITLSVEDNYVGGALVENRLYIATEKGLLFALGDIANE
jgi:peptide/nickel transport system permease protein